MWKLRLEKDMVAIAPNVIKGHLNKGSLKFNQEHHHYVQYKGTKFTSLCTPGP